MFSETKLKWALYICSFDVDSESSRFALLLTHKIIGRPDLDSWAPLRELYWNSLISFKRNMQQEAL